MIYDDLPFLKFVPIFKKSLSFNKVSTVINIVCVCVFVCNLSKLNITMIYKKFNNQFCLILTQLTLLFPLGPGFSWAIGFRLCWTISDRSKFEITKTKPVFLILNIIYWYLKSIKKNSISNVCSQLISFRIHYLQTHNNYIILLFLRFRSHAVLERVLGNKHIIIVIYLWTYNLTR